MDGQRHTKTVNGKTTTYRYNNGLLLSEQTGDETLRYYYDATGKVTSFTYKKGSNAEVSYFYTRNLQGDIIAIYRNSDSALIGTYEYDLWGRPVSETEIKGIDTNGILAKNPFRYRGYYYDTETGFYNLSARYYDPEIRRFISPDDIAVLNANFENMGQYNLYVYCWNNPVNMTDETGNWPTWVKKTIAVVAVAAVVVAATAITVGTFRAGSVAGVAMITATATLAARTTEVAVLQAKKGKMEGKSGSEIAKDTMESIYDNGGKIVGYTPYTKSVGIGANHLLRANVESIFGGKQTLSATLGATGGKVVPYAFVAFAWGRTAVSAFSKDPVARAEERGYMLK